MLLIYFCLVQRFLRVQGAKGSQFGISGHLAFFSIDSIGSAFELGILFHAKEHPEEFTNRMGPVLPVCSLESGGQNDPRRGTRLSIKNHNFKDRNFLWLLSMNATFRFDLSKFGNEHGSKSQECDVSDLLAPGASGSRFFTIDESSFGTQLGTIYYLPEAHDPAVPYASLGSSEHFDRAQRQSTLRDVLCVPCHGFPPDWHLARALRTQTEEAAIQSVHDIDDKLLVLLGSSQVQQKRVQRLGSSERRRRLLSLAQTEKLGNLECGSKFCSLSCTGIMILLQLYTHTYSAETSGWRWRERDI